MTGRDAHYGGAEVWEVVPDGPPKAPIVLTTQWDIGEDIVPGTLRLSDAETGQALATVELSQGRGMWDLVVASGQVLRYAFESESGELVEGTYALPEVAGSGLDPNNDRVRGGRRNIYGGKATFQKSLAHAFPEVGLGHGHQ